MEDLLQSQIRESCRLALPEGLKDLMADISREVLRAQPANLYQFIADYLSTLLVAREHLFIAARVCNDICDKSCCADLEDELRALPLSDEDLHRCLKIVSGYFSNGEVKEGNLLQKLVKETAIDVKDLPAVQGAVRRAFLRHRLNNSTQYEASSTDSDLDETSLAVKHTLGIYKKVTDSPDVNYDCVATKIQAAYRAYNVRRARQAPNKAHSKKTEDATEKVRFQNKDKTQQTEDQQAEQLIADLVKSKRCASKCSSVSLAGSLIDLPLYKPYSTGQRSDISEIDEVGEKEQEHANFDYVTNELGTPTDIQLRDPESNKNKGDPENKGKKTISFHNLPRVVELEDDNEVKDETYEVDYESEEVEEDMFDEHFSDAEKADDVKELPNDEVTTLETAIVSERKGDETDSSVSSIEDDVDEVQRDEMETILEYEDGDDIEQAEGDNFERTEDDRNKQARNTSNEMQNDTNTKPVTQNVADNDFADEDYENFYV